MAVLPRPMSSARIAPSPSCSRKASQARPRSWYGRSVPVKPSGAGTGSSRRSTWPASRSPSGPSAVTDTTGSPAGSVRRGQSGVEQVGDGHLARRGDHLQPGGEPLRVQLDPLAAQPYQRRLELGQRLELVLGQRLVAERQLPLIVHKGLEARARSWRPPCPGAVGEDADSRAPSRARGLLHQPGSSTPKPAPASIGAPCCRNWCAPAASRSRPAGLAVRSESSRSG